jgi:branched-subunit amino acid ABC-type transport system permease component
VTSVGASTMFAAASNGLFQQLLTYSTTGLALAAIYAIASSGLVVTYTTSGIFNFAHGAFGMMAAFMYWQFSASDRRRRLGLVDDRLR